jgi:hypothetical protein
MLFPAQIDSADRGFLTTIDFELAGFPKDKLQVQVKCEKCSCSDKKVSNARECSGRGDLVCGGCECNAGVSYKTSIRILCHPHISREFVITVIN